MSLKELLARISGTDGCTAIMVMLVEWRKRMRRVRCMSMPFFALFLSSAIDLLLLWSGEMRSL